MKALLDTIEEKKNLLPKPYKKTKQPDDLQNIALHLDKIIKNPKKSASFKGNIERFYLHRFSYKKLSKRLNRLLPFNIPSTQLIEIVFNKTNNFILTTFYHELSSKAQYTQFHPIQEEAILQLKDKKQGLHISTKKLTTHSVMTLEILNVSSITTFKNLVENIKKSKTSLNYIKIWVIKSHDKKTKTYHKIDIHFTQFLSKEEIQSLKDDFTRYLHQYIKPLSVFDMIGPSMIGPSSSHTAGANRIGQLARNFFIMLEDYILKHSTRNPPSVEIQLYSSFAETGIGHKTPDALGAGLLGYETDSPNMTSYGHPDYIKKHFHLLKDKTIQFLGYKKVEIQEKQDSLSANTAKIILHLDDEEISITGVSIGGGNVEIRCINDVKLSDVITGKTDMPLSLFLKHGKAKGIIPKIYPVKQQSTQTAPPFNTMEEFLQYQKQTKKDIIDIILELEYDLQGSSPKEVYQRLKTYWHIMKDSITHALEHPKKSEFGLTGGEAQKMQDFSKKASIFKDNIYEKSVIYATSVNEYNAQSGLIVACPTAGSAGIVPGVLKAYQELQQVEDQDIYHALLVSGFLGMILFNDVTTAGAAFGCQAEIGAAAAMAAAGITYLESGSNEAIVHAFTLAIKNSLGLVCDPVGGLVEVPCVKRNGIYSSMALSASFMALSGVRSFISPDEVILAMQEVGNKLNKDYKETARGGLAKTRDGKEVNIKMKNLIDRFFNE